MGIVGNSASGAGLFVFRCCTMGSLPAGSIEYKLGRRARRRRLGEGSQSPSLKNSLASKPRGVFSWEELTNKHS